jgi:D-alanyl-D-alanine carboxypeptidase
MRGRRLLLVAGAGALSVTTLAACGSGSAGAPSAAADAEAAEAAPPATTAPPATAPGTTAGDTAGTTTETTAPPASPPLTRPDWLGTRVLTPVPGQPPPPTPAELDPRRLPTIDVLPPPADGGFHATVQAVPGDVAARSTWQASCPVTLDELRYVTVSFRGFDDLAHTGELLVHRDAADPLVGVFRELFAMRFPIEDMHITSRAELDAPNTGDGNATAAFVCRPTRGGSRWSEHAYGLAVDINPFQNPYARNGDVIPGLASSYLDRADVRPGMLVPGGPVIEAFTAIGWEWGGAWTNPIDYMHFSAAGR